MKNNDRSASSPEIDRNKTNIESDIHRKNWRQIRIQLAVIFLIIIFLAGECAALIPLN